MSINRRLLSIVLSVIVVFVLLLPSAGVGTAMAASTNAKAPGCDRVIPFDPENFTRPLDIDNRFMPLAPGTQFIYSGFITPLGGTAQAVDHRVIFTVTDLTKVIDGVRTRVVYDVDVNSGEVAEAELAFFAEDKDSRVWNLGEYPEEYENGQFVGAPSTWIAGQAGAIPGVHMFWQAERQVGKPSYLQGYAPKIDFLDCGQMVDKGQSANGYNGVLVSYETSPLDPEGGIQVKYYAPRVGIVQVGAIDDPEAETLLLTKLVKLDPDKIAQIHEQALALDTHAYEVSKVYRKTEPAK